MKLLTQLILGISGLLAMLVIALAFLGKLAFGYGLGDMFYLMGIMLWLLFLIVLYLFSRKFDLLSNKLWFIFLTSIILLFSYIIVASFTINRGSEARWNGHILRNH